MADKPTGLQKPAGAASQGAEPVIHVIPEKFYGAALRQKVAPLPGSPASGTAPAAPADTATQAAVAAGVSGAPPKSGKKKWLVIGLVVAIVLLGGGAAAFFLLQPKTPPVVVNAPVNTAPAAPVCGDGTCNEATESVANCSADCKPAAPVCGDAKCDTGESFAACPADCPAPAPVCGDSKCDAPNETPQTCEADCRAPEAKPGADLDSDGMSDKEETEVFGSNINDPNSDHDSFVDLNEALNLFDPATPSPTLLKGNPKILALSDAANGFSLLRPAAWSVQAPTPPSKVTTLAAPSGETIAVNVVDKPEAQSLMDWYLQQAPGVTSSQVEPYKTRSGYLAVLSPDRMTAYVDLGARVVTVTYKLGAAKDVQYRVTFQMVVQSIVKL